MELIESIAIFIAGYLIGHFLATKRDKSNSFRESIKEYEKSLNRYIKNENSALPNLQDMHLLSKYLYLHKKYKFDSLVSDLENSVQADASNHKNYDPVKEIFTIVDTSYKSQTPKIAKKLLDLVRKV